MHSYGETKHQLTIYSVHPNSNCPAILEAPAIALARESFVFRESYSPKTGHSEILTVQSIANKAHVDFAHQSAQATPTPFILANCAFQSEIHDLGRPLEKYQHLWKLYHIVIGRSKCTFRFAHVPSLQKDARITTDFTFPSAFLKLDCHIRYGAKEHYKFESYRCRFNTYDTPDDHAPVEIGIRSRRNRPNQTQPRKDDYNCAYTIRDFLH